MKKESLLLYRTYYKPSQLADIDATEEYVIPYNTNSTEFPTNVLNPYWSEFIVMRNIWKQGKKSDYIGFDQYDFHFEPSMIEELDYGQILTLSFIKVSSLRENFEEFHNSDFSKDMVDVMNKIHGKNNKYVEEYNTGTDFYCKSCFVMSWECFDNMCEFIFKIIDTYVEDFRIGFDLKRHAQAFDGLGPYNKRQIGFFCERLISIWITTIKKDMKEQEKTNENSSEKD